MNIPTDVPAMWDPNSNPDPSAMLPSEVAVQQVQMMASVVLALLNQPFSESFTEQLIILLCFGNLWIYT